MIGTLAFRSPSPDLGGADLLPASSLLAPPRPRPRSGVVVCCGQRSNASIPKLEPFSRTRLERAIKDPPLLHKTEKDLTDYCSTLEGDEACSCWDAYFELKNLEKEMPKEDVEKFVRQAGGVKSLIDLLHGIAAMGKRYKMETEKSKVLSSESRSEKPFPVPDGLPKTKEELEEEEKARMPDSAFTRLLRTMGRFPAWYTPAPDHETD